METLNEYEILARISARKRVNALLDDGSLQIHINDYTFFVCTAIHAGHNLTHSLEKNCLLSKVQRLQEEDEFTDKLIATQPIQLIIHDSRYEYDLNRDESEYLYEYAWGKKVWKEPLVNRLKQKSLAKHRRYYRILTALLKQLMSIHRQCLVFDVHSYNYQMRHYIRAPVFNLGTAFLDNHLYQHLIKLMSWQLSAIEIPGIDVDVMLNEVYVGDGFHAQFVHDNFGKHVALIPLEIKKIYMDEYTGKKDEVIFKWIKQGLERSIKNISKKIVS
jgi:N-formylglutamate amidohydrolase